MVQSLFFSFCTLAYYFSSAALDFLFIQAGFLDRGFKFTNGV